MGTSILESLKIFITDEISTNLYWFLFIGCALLVFVIALILPRLIVYLLQKFKISPVFITIFILSFITSLPELISIIFFPIIEGDGINGAFKAFSNIFGANFLSFAILSILDLIFFRWLFFKSYSRNMKITSGLIMIFNLVFFLSFLFPDSFLNSKIFKISLFLLFLLIIYLIFSIYAYRHQKPSKSTEHFQGSFTYKYPRSIIFILLVFFIFTLLLLMIVLIILSNQIQHIYNFSPQSVGGILFALITSSPEIWSTIGMFWIGLGSASIGIILGSHLINMIMLMFLEIEKIHSNFYLAKLAENGETLEWEPATILIFVTLLTSFIMFFRFFKVSTHKKNYFLFPTMIILIYIISWTQLL